MLDSRCIERLAASLQRGPGGHHVIDQHHPSSAGARARPKSTRHVGAALARGQAALLGRGAMALQQLRGKPSSDALRQRASQQPGGIEAPLDEPRIMERHRDHAPITYRCRGNESLEWPRQQPRERPRQIGSMAELEPANRRRERRRVAATHPAVEPDAESGRSGTGATARAEELVALHGGVAGGAVVGEEDAREHMRTKPSRLDEAPRHGPSGGSCQPRERPFLAH